MSQYMRVECPKCGRMLLKAENGHQFNIEVKCQSCKSLVKISGKPQIETELVPHIHRRGYKPSETK